MYVLPSRGMAKTIRPSGTSKYTELSKREPLAVHDDVHALRVVQRLALFHSVLFSKLVDPRPRGIHHFLRADGERFARKHVLDFRARDAPAS